MQFATQIGVRVDVHVSVSVRVDDHLHQLVAVRARHRIAAPTIALIGQVGTEDDVRHRVRLPFKAEVARQLVVRRQVLRVVLRKLGQRGIEILCRRLVLIVAAVIAIAHAAARLQFRLGGGEVGANLFAALQTFAAPSPATTTAAESHVRHVVGIADDRRLEVILESVHVQALCIAMLCACTQVHVAKPAVLHALFHRQVQHRLLLAVVDACHARAVALPFVGLQLVNHVRGDVLHCHLLVVQEKLLAVYENLANFLAVDLDGAILVHLRARQLLHQSLQRRAFRHAIGRRVIHQRVALHLHLHGVALHHHALQFQTFPYCGVCRHRVPNVILTLCHRAGTRQHRNHY